MRKKSKIISSQLMKLGVKQSEFEIFSTRIPVLHGLLGLVSKIEWTLIHYSFHWFGECLQNNWEDD